jgi:two-component SAPR family response regulator
LEEQYPVNNTKQKYGSLKTGVSSSILVLDDELDITSFIKSALHRTKHTVFTFTDPVLALEHFKLNSNNYGLVISDIRMPGMNGFEFVKKVKEINSAVKIFLMSAFEIRDIEFDKVLPNPHLDGFIQKPISSKQLTEIIEKAI